MHSSLPKQCKLSNLIHKNAYDHNVVQNVIKDVKPDNQSVATASEVTQINDFLSESKFSPKVVESFNALDDAEQARLIESFVKRKKAKEAKRKEIDLNKVANVLGVDIGSFSNSELEEIKKLVSNAQFEKALSYAGIEMSSLSNSTLEELSYLLHNYDKEEENKQSRKLQEPEQATLQYIAPYAEIRNGGINSILLNDEDLEALSLQNTEKYLDVVAQMNKGFYPTAPIEDNVKASSDDPYQAYREERVLDKSPLSEGDLESKEINDISLSYVEQAASSEQRARVN